METEKTPEKLNINHISVSRDGTFKECAKKYYYRYHMGLIPKTEPIYFLYGKIVHKVIEVYTRSKGKQNINEIIKLVFNGDIVLEEATKDKPAKTVDRPLPPEYKAKLPIHITNAMKLLKNLGFDADVEWHFNHDLNPPHGKNLVGFIDYLKRTDDKCLIIDYKTTKKGPWRKNSSNIGTDLQLQCYAKVAQRNFGYKANQITCALYFLEGPELVPVQFSQETIDTVEETLLKTYTTIETTDAESVQGNVGNHCYRCDYAKVCPFFQQSLKWS